MRSPFKKINQPAISIANDHLSKKQNSDRLSNSHQPAVASLKINQSPIAYPSSQTAITSHQNQTNPNNRVGTKQSAITNCLRMQIMMGDRCQCYRKWLALSISQLEG